MSVRMMILITTTLVLSAAKANEHKNQNTSHSKSNAEKTQTHQQYVDLPAGCFSKQKYPCSLRTSENGLIVEKKNYRIIMKPQTVLTWNSDSEMRFVSGDVWLDSKEERLSLILGPLLAVDFSGQVAVGNQEDQGLVRLQNLSSDMSFKSQGLLASEAVPVGFENWYSVISSEKQIQRGVIKPIDKIAFFKNWMTVAVLSAAELKSRFKEFSLMWRGNVEQASRFYQKIIERRVANAEEEQENKKQELLRQKKQREKIRKLYRQKNYLEEN